MGMALFRVAAYRHLWWSTVASAAAHTMERTITAWLALELGAGPVAIGVIFAARMLPSLLLGLVAGTVADRVNRRSQLLAVGAIGLVLLIGFAGLVAAGGAGVWQLVGFSFASGCLQVFDTPARQALVLDTAPQDVVMRALALNALAARFAAALGAFGAGLLLPWAGVARAYLVTAALVGLMALLVLRVRAPREQHSGQTHPPFRHAFRDAVRLMIDVPTVLTLVVAGLVCEVFAFSHMTALPLFAQDVLRAGPAGLGTLNAAVAIGGALAVTLLTLLPERMPRQPLLGAIFVTYGLALVGLASARDLWLAAAVLVLVGFCAGSFDLLQQTLLQLAVPAEQRGRALGLWVFSIGSAPLGHLQMGALIAALGVPVALLINGTLTALAALTLIVRVPIYRGRIARPKPHVEPGEPR